MKYGYFDDKNREYVIERPDTPTPWVNYLGSPEYGAIISNNAGGYSFAKSGANGRILRYIFNQFDQPGRYIYIRDNATKDYWSASWQPVGKDLDSYKSQCCHGMGYSRFIADYSQIHSEAIYYVPLGKTHEVWAITVTNTSDVARELTLTGYAEFTNHSNYEQDQVNLQYSLFITRTLFEENRIIQQIHGNLDALDKNEEVDNKQVTERFFGLAGADVSSYAGDKSAFLGNYHGYGNPIGVSSGDLGNKTSNNGNSCGALSCCIKLEPQESKTIFFLLGMKPSNEAKEIIDTYKNEKNILENELNSLKNDWYNKLDHLKVRTPDASFNTMINTWNAYNCFITFVWSRAASFIYCGLRNGYGYRDTVQDIQGIIHLEPEMAYEKICFMLSAQVSNGSSPLFKDPSGMTILPLGTIAVQETKAAPGYTLDGEFTDKHGNTFKPNKKYVTQIKDSNSGIVIQGGNKYSAEDTPVFGSIKIKKLDSDGKTPLSNAKFELKNKKGTVLTVKTTNTKGEILFDNLYPDVYTITELETPDGHTLLKDPLVVEVPTRVTESDMQKYDIDKSQCVYNQKEGVWYIHNFTYKITNHMTFDIPMTGGFTTGWVFLPLLCGFLALGAFSILVFRRRRH